jgi:hypothetical protein
MLGPVKRFWLVMVLGFVALAGCGDDGAAPRPPDKPPAASNDSLTFTRKDGSTFALKGTTVRCRPGRTEGGRSITVWSPVPSKPKAVGGATYFLFEAAIGYVADGRTVQLPYDEYFSGVNGVMLFASDARTKNEVSAAKDAASGTIRFTRASCDPTPSVEAEVHATLGSELTDGEPITVDGTLKFQG